MANGTKTEEFDASRLTALELESSILFSENSTPLAEPSDSASNQAYVGEMISELDLDQELPESLFTDEQHEEVSTAFVDIDAEVVLAFLKGSDTAFVELYAKYEAPLLLYCRRMMSNDRMAEDAFQEIWMRVFELRKAFIERQVGVSCFRALLFRSARNLCLNTIRLERYRAGSSEALEDITASDESNHSVEQKEMKALLTKALAKLPFEQREAFVLHEYSGYSYGEIAEMMATSEVNIKVRAYRARTRLRKVIGSWLGLGEDDDPTNSI